MSHKFNHIWKLADGFPAKGIKPNNLKVFGTFVCGGGSAMGYKLAGYDYLGGVEIDPKVAEIYKENLKPKYLFIDDIRDFNKRDDLPKELYELDILDGSPPCTTFSINGEREKTWGKEKKFAEGQKMQRLDDLVFVYCDTIAKLKPKVCMLENVGGLIQGNGKVYAKAIIKRMQEIGYQVQLFLLNSKNMGVPQSRERVFFIGLRKDFDLPKLKLEFREPIISFGKIKDKLGEKLSTEYQLNIWNHRNLGDKHFGDVNKRLRGKESRFNARFAYDHLPAPSLTTGRNEIIHFAEPLFASDSELLKIATFPVDYNHKKTARFLAGMCVPPVMTAQIATQIYEQWFRRITDGI